MAAGLINRVPKIIEKGRPDDGTKASNPENTWEASWRYLGGQGEARQNSQTTCHKKLLSLNDLVMHIFSLRLS